MEMEAKDPTIHATTIHSVHGHSRAREMAKIKVENKVK